MPAAQAHGDRRLATRGSGRGWYTPATAVPYPTSPSGPRPIAVSTLEHELKFVVASAAAAPLVAWVESVCQRDAGYPPGTVHTVYYDTPQWSLLHEKINSDYLKAKVRVRWYADRDGRVGEALFAEVKYRIGNRRYKLRARLDVGARDAAVRPLHDRQWVGWLDPLRALAPALPMSLTPVLGLSYVRHRFADPARAARVTIDERIAVDRVNRSRFHGMTAGAVAGAVFEYKGREPELPAALAPVIRFGARRGPLSKYLACYQHVTRTTL